MTTDGVPTLPQLIEFVRALNRVIRGLEEQLATAGDEHADAEGAYRAQYAFKLRQHRQDNATVAEAEAYARAEVAVLDSARILADHRVRRLLETLEDRRGERASLNRLIDAIGGQS